jgi:Rrf2 family protein
VAQQIHHPDSIAARRISLNSTVSIEIKIILNDLKSVGAVESKRGVAGGYRLARPPKEISLASVIRHIEGALAPVSCVSERFYEKCSCPDEVRRAIRSVMKEVRDAAVNILEKLSVADLCALFRQLQEIHAGPLDIMI